MLRRTQARNEGHVMGKTGRTRARSGGSQHGGQRQPVFSILTTEDTPEAQRTCTPADQDVPPPEDALTDRHSHIHTPPEDHRMGEQEEESQQSVSRH
eukprot:3964609-Pleurochrysis_carterae.AAC.1